MIRPRDPARAAWCADVLLRSGAFALVVLDGAPPLIPRWPRGSCDWRTTRTPRSS